MDTLFAIVDCQSFYASCERVFDPSIRTVPVAVLSNNDGCIVARSEEVKRAGIKMGVPFFQARKELERIGARVFSSNYTLYGDMSRRVMDVLGMLAKEVEVYSIDEAFLKLPRVREADLMDLGHSIQRQVMRWTGVPVRVGFGPTKTLAKVSQVLAKQEGVSVFETPAGRDDLLERVPAGDVWGIGHRYSKKLEGIEVKNARQFRDLPDGWLRKHMTVVGLRTALELRGISCLGIEHVEPEHKTIVRSRSFGERITELADLEEAVSSYASRAAEKLRRYEMTAAMIQVFVTTGGFGEGPHYSNSCAAALPEATAYTPTIVTSALACLRRVFREGYRYQKAGVVLLELAPASSVQTNLFVRHDPRHVALMSAVDAINRKMGSGTVYVAAAGRDLKQTWAMRRERMSPRYTTCWDEVPVVKARD